MPRTNLSDVFTRDEIKATGAKIIARNTFQRTDPATGAVITRLHRTDIVTRYPDGTEVLTSGGWQTITTRDRINLASRFRLTQRKGVWYVGDGEGNEVPFRDGITLPRDFGGPGAQAARRAGEEAEALRKAVKKFSLLIKAGEPLPQPGPGDCWLCMMRDADGKTLGEMRGVEGEREHLLGHIEEGYMHGSLIVNAFRHCGYRDAGIAYYFGRASDYAVTAARRAVRRYLYAKLGLAV